MKSVLLAIFFYFHFCASNAQYQDTVWVVSGKTELGDGFKKWRMDFVLDARTTFVGGQSSRLGGLRLGAEYRRVHRFGIGIYGLNNQLGRETLSTIDANVDSALFSFNYLSLYYERVLFFHPKWEWSGTVHAGSGDIKVAYSLEGEEEFQQLEPISVRPLEFSTSGYYHISWWLSVGTGVGYRYMRKAPDEVKSIYNSSIYLIKMKIRFGRLVKSVWNKDVKNEY